MTTTRVVVAVDAGGTAVKAGTFDIELAMVSEHTIESRRMGGPEAALGALVDAAEDLLAGARTRELEVAGIGVAVPGYIDEAQGRVVVAENIGWRDLPLRDILEDRLALPVALGHDVRLAATAEHRLGAGRGRDDFFFVTLGTGIGGALIAGGRIYNGARGAVGEIGHTTVEADGAPCVCGRRGCLETEAGGPAIAARYARETGESFSVREIFERATGGERAAAAVVDHVVAMLARAFLNAALLYDPEMIVVGGGIATAGATLFGPLNQRMEKEFPWPGCPAAVPAELGPGAGRLGAAIRAWERVGR